MERLRAGLVQRGASLQPSWLASLSPPPSTPDQAWAALLNADLKHAGAAVLPEDISSPTSQYHGTVLQGPVLLQVEDVNNIAENWKGRKANSSNRCLKLTLSDGHTHVGAFEYTQVTTLNADAPYGLKVRVANVRVRRGLLLLDPTSITVLGGSAPTPAPSIDENAMQDASVVMPLAPPAPAPKFAKPAPPAKPAAPVSAPPPPKPTPSTTPKQKPAPPPSAKVAPPRPTPAPVPAKPSAPAPVKQVTLQEVMKKREATKQVKVIDLEDLVDAPVKSGAKRKEERPVELDDDDIVLYDEQPAPAAAATGVADERPPGPEDYNDDDIIVGGDIDESFPPEEVLLELEREAAEQERKRKEDAYAEYAQQVLAEEAEEQGKMRKEMEDADYAEYVQKELEEEAEYQDRLQREGEEELRKMDFEARVKDMKKELEEEIEYREKEAVELEEEMHKQDLAMRDTHKEPEPSVVTLAAALKAPPTRPVLVSAYVITVTSRSVLDKETQRYALRVLIDDGSATTPVRLGEEITTQLMGGITASEYSQRASKPEERQTLIDAINHAKSVLVKLEGAFQLSWQNEDIILEQVTDVPLAYCRHLAGRLKKTLAAS